jgi:succinate dehydrogenase / fumarate reductase, membrane anchor subunit
VPGVSLRTPIAKARGLGSARAGVHHWTVQRLTAIANVPLVLWFIASAVALSGATYAETVAWLSSPITATLMILLIVSVFYHARLGLQVIIEDYVHHTGAKMAALAAVTLGIVALAVACIVAVLTVSLGTVPALETAP